MGQRFGFGWALLLAAVLVWTGACTASRPPTPTPTATATPEPTPTAQATQAGQAVEITATQTEPDQAAEITATLAPDQDAGDENIATPTAQQPQDQATGDTAEDAAEQGNTEAAIQKLQSAYAQLAEKYADGYEGTLAVSYRASGDVGGIGHALWNAFSNIQRSLDPEGEIISSLALELFLRENPDARVIITMQGTNMVYCPVPGDMTVCQFYGAPASFAFQYRYDDRFKKVVIDALTPLDAGGEFYLKKARVTAAESLLAGQLPSDPKGAYARWTDWRLEAYVVSGDQTLPIVGFDGRSRYRSFDDSGYTYTDARIEVISPDGLIDSAELQDVLELLNVSASSK